MLRRNLFHKSFKVGGYLSKDQMIEKGDTGRPVRLRLTVPETAGNKDMILISPPTSVQQLAGSLLHECCHYLYAHYNEQEKEMMNQQILRLLKTDKAMQEIAVRISPHIQEKQDNEEWFTELLAYAMQYNLKQMQESSDNLIDISI